MTAVTVIESDSSYVNGNFGLYLARVLVAASGDTLTTPFKDIVNVQLNNETNGGQIWASESSAGVITFGTAAITGAGVATNNVISLSIWGTK